MLVSFWLAFYVVFKDRWVLFGVAFLGIALGLSLPALGEQWIAVDNSNVMSLVSFDAGAFDYILGVFLFMVNVLLAVRAAAQPKK